jgi:hypothetical protein|tara:strand:- start:416 stop:541 length:126 start_codon:yes stop_codon:yes gene_type:complete
MSDKSHNSIRYHIFDIVDEDSYEVLGRDIGTDWLCKNLYIK